MYAPACNYSATTRLVMGSYARASLQIFSHYRTLYAIPSTSTLPSKIWLIMAKAKYHHVYITKFISFRCCSLLSISFSEPPFPWSRGTEALIWERDWSSVGIHPWRMCGTLRDRDDRDLFLAFPVSRSKSFGVATKLLFKLSYMTYFSIQIKMADHDMSPLHGKKPCRACTSFKSWMKQENRRKSTAVSLYLITKLKELEHTLTKQSVMRAISKLMLSLHHIFW